jgi:hypothetical protein
MADSKKRKDGPGGDRNGKGPKRSKVCRSRFHCCVDARLRTGESRVRGQVHTSSHGRVNIGT